MENDLNYPFNATDMFYHKKARKLIVLIRYLDVGIREDLASLEIDDIQMKVVSIGRTVKITCLLFRCDFV